MVNTSQEKVQVGFTIPRETKRMVDALRARYGGATKSAVASIAIERLYREHFGEDPKW